MRKVLITSTIAALILLNGCSPSTEEKTSPQTGSTTSEPSTPTGSTEESNKAPIVNAGADKSVTVNETTTITGTANDSDGTISTIEWKKGNEVLATTLSFSYTPTEVRTDTLTLTVMDDDGATASDSVNIVVVEDSNDNSFDDVKK